jgi:hypothetical protein
VERVVLNKLKINREDLHSHGRHAGTAKGLAIEFSCRFSGKTQREVGQYYGYTGDGGVSKQRKRLAFKLSVDKELMFLFNNLSRVISKSIVQV